LSAHVVDRAMDQGRILAFAFLSYKHGQSATKLDILQSLVFQLLQDHQHLRPVLIDAYKSHCRQLQCSTKFVGDLLQKIISSIAGITFFVVDGLDEINKTERQDLLKALLELSNSCSNMRLLISSRTETDILRLG
jgi:hypothetical protein